MVRHQVLHHVMSITISFCKMTFLMDTTQLSLAHARKRARWSGRTIETMTGRRVKGESKTKGRGDTLTRLPLSFSSVRYHMYLMTSRQQQHLLKQRRGK